MENLETNNKKSISNYYVNMFFDEQTKKCYDENKVFIGYGELRNNIVIVTHPVKK